MPIISLGNNRYFSTDTGETMDFSDSDITVQEIAWRSWGESRGQQGTVTSASCTIGEPFEEQLQEPSSCSTEYTHYDMPTSSYGSDITYSFGNPLIGYCISPREQRRMDSERIQAMPQEEEGIPMEEFDLIEDLN